MKSFAELYFSRKICFILFLGFFSGIPLALTGSTLQVWMTESHIDITIIGAFSLVGIPYAWKIWAPLLDRYLPPILGRRRGWLLLTQIALAIAIAFMAFLNPTTGVGLIAIAAVAVAFFSSTQDIVIDAYRIETLKPDQQAAGASVFVIGYRLAMLFSGAFVLIMTSDQGWNISWKSTYLLMSGIMLVSTLFTLSGSEPEANYQPKTLKEAILVPFWDFFKRPGSLEIILFISLYKLDVVVAQSLLSRFLLDMHFSKIDLAKAYKLFGMAATLAGGLAGGYFYPKLGAFRCLLFFGIFQGLSTLLLACVALVGHEHWILYTAVAGENFASGMGTTAYSAFLALLCNRKFTATQYALLTSLMAVTRTIGASPSGFMAKFLGVTPPLVLVSAQDLITQGWTHYFYFCALLALPALLMLTRFSKWTINPVD